MRRRNAMLPFYLRMYAFSYRRSWRNRSLYEHLTQSWRSRAAPSDRAVRFWAMSLRNPRNEALLRHTLVVRYADDGLLFHLTSRYVEGPCAVGARWRAASRTLFSQRRLKKAAYASRQVLEALADRRVVERPGIRKGHFRPLRYAMANGPFPVGPTYGY